MRRNIAIGPPRMGKQWPGKGSNVRMGTTATFAIMAIN
jgi:hypothetical protein